MHSAKRRRLGDTASTLTRPFRSPLSTNIPTTQTAVSLNDAESPRQSSTKLSAHDAAIKSSPLPERRSYGYSLRRSTLSSPTRPSSDPEYLSLQKQHSALVLQLRHLSNSVDTSAQAAKILKSNADADLERLVQKWRLASRNVAEELFSIAKDRVNRMGGVSAWREKCKPPDDEDESPWGGSAGFDEDELTDEQKEELEIARDEARQEAERYRILEKPSQASMERDDDSFTMDMMLKQLNVDLDVIGYDLRSQRWSE